MACRRSAVRSRLAPPDTLTNGPLGGPFAFLPFRFANGHGAPVAPRAHLFFGFLLLALLTGCAAAPLQSHRVLVEGAPEPGRLDALAAAGVTHLVDLRTAPEKDDSVPRRAAELGLAYVSLPVGREAASDEVIERYGAILDELGDDDRVLLFCASGNRAAEVRARSEILRGRDPAAALEAARAAGLRPEREAFVVRAGQALRP